MGTHREEAKAYAEELVKKFENFSHYHDADDCLNEIQVGKKNAIQCALIAEEVIQLSNPTIKGNSEDLITMIVQTKAFYAMVKEELLKMEL